MKKNNKGFAISIMLYAMVLLIVTIFYIILAIVKNRYNTSEELVDTAVSFMEANDPYAAASDKTAPLVVFDHNGLTLGDSVSADNFKVYIYDDNISPSGITLKTGTGSSISLTCVPNENGQPVYQCVPRTALSINTTPGYIDLILTAVDGTSATPAEKRNKTEVRKRFYKAKGPSCSVTVIDEKTCNQYVHTCRELVHTTEGGIKKYTLLQGDYAIYQITCTSNSGIDAFFKDSDFAPSTTKVLGEFKVTTERSDNTAVLKIIVRGGATGDNTTLKVNGGTPGNIKICDSYNGGESETNCSNVTLPLINVVQPAATH